MAPTLAIEQWYNYEGEDWWSWAVWIEGTDNTLDLVDSVEWTLHPTFPNPIRKTRDRARKFRISTGGWGTFQIRALVKMKDDSHIKLKHDLELHYPAET